MKIINLKVYSILLVLMIFTACKVTKVLPNNTPVKNFKIKELQKAINSSRSNLKLFRSRLKVTYDDGKRAQELVVNLRMKENEAIWLSATMLIPIAKLLIKPNDIAFYEKFQKTSYQGKLEFINDFFGVDFNYKNLERLFLGRATIDVNKQNWNRIKNPNFYVISLTNKTSLIQPILFYNPTTFMLKEQRLFFTKKKRFISIIYDDFQSIEDNLVPSKMTISFSDDIIRRKIIIEYTRPEVPGNLTFPFKIPQGYKKINL
tara:strand:+ start:1910 stop:2689 length:780 start_codon:yes stop_codon:yes gene_type:complete